jgi:hypothetical protein
VNFTDFASLCYELEKTLGGQAGKISRNFGNHVGADHQSPAVAGCDLEHGARCPGRTPAGCQHRTGIQE